VLYFEGELDVGRALQTLRAIDIQKTKIRVKGRADKKLAVYQGRT
jgi:hypothetical protein